MLKSANHLSKVRKVKVMEKDTETMLAGYNVSIALCMATLDSFLASAARTRNAEREFWAMSLRGQLNGTDFPVYVLVYNAPVVIKCAPSMCSI